ncbi:MAG TPA: hypothetical protein VK458_06500 [Myxococcaceae bacterium]|nr:hypothetical protein [Myxococcaceae bacterium]
MVGFSTALLALLLRRHARHQHQRPCDARGAPRVEGRGGRCAATAASTQASPWNPAVLKLSARGSGPVTLTGSVDGQVLLTVTDSDPGVLSGEGLAGLATPIAGVWFDDFQVRSLQ